MSPFSGNPWWTAIVAVVPALLACILLFMDQQITAVIVNRKEHKLKVRIFHLWISAKLNVYCSYAALHKAFHMKNSLINLCHCFHKILACLLSSFIFFRWWCIFFPILQKGGGYHLDLFILAVLTAFNSVLGLPWFVAATVLSINHVNSLKLESECAAPGEKPQFLGVR